MRQGHDRLAYLDGLVRYMNERLRDAGERASAVAETLMRIPFADQLIEITNDDAVWTARELPDARDQLSFDVDRLSIAFLDSRKRTSRERLSIRTGRASPLFARIIGALQPGTTRTELEELCGDAWGDVESIVDRLLAAGVIDELAELDDPVAGRLLGLEGDQVTWLGHAAAAVHSQGTTIWVDPLLVPRMCWLPDELDHVFSPTHADSVLFEPYGPEAPNLSLAELPRPDAVLITHQDADHVDVGVLMMLADEIPIIVPRADPARPWEVDLAVLLRECLGSERRIITLSHGETASFGSVNVTAFPFRGEMPDCLPHSWNCYLLETPRSAIAFTADSRIHDEEIEFLIERQQGKQRPLVLFSGPGGRQETTAGWREEPDDLYNCLRLYPWYAPLHTMFKETRFTTLHYADMGRLATEARLRAYFPYAVGSAPWFRLQDKADPLYTGLSSLSVGDLEDIERSIARLGTPLRVLPARYGTPIRIDVL